MSQKVSDSLPSPAGLFIRTGHFIESPAYRTVRPRGTKDWLLVYTIGGRGRFGYSTGELAAAPGTLTLTLPGTFHDYGTARDAGQWELLWTHFQPRIHWAELLNWPLVSEGLMQLFIGDSPHRDEIVSLFWKVHRIAVGGRPRRDLFAAAALEEMLLWCDLANPQSGAPAVDVRVSSAIDFICSNLDTDLSVERIAGHVICSPSRLAHLFKQQAGVSLQQFVEMRRIERAKQLLAVTGRPIQAIAADIGYASPFYFSLRFKRFTGESPSDFRRRIVAEG